MKPGEYADVDLAQSPSKSAEVIAWWDGAKVTILQRGGYVGEASITTPPATGGRDGEVMKATLTEHPEGKYWLTIQTYGPPLKVPVDDSQLGAAERVVKEINAQPPKEPSIDVLCLVLAIREKFPDIAADDLRAKVSQHRREAQSLLDVISMAKP